jgi:hypothetical protein
VGISLWRLSTLQEFHATAANVKLSLYTFYSMSCLEASIFLAERSYWYYKISWGKLLEDVKAKAGLQEEENDEGQKQHQQQDHHSEFLVTFFYEVSVPQEEEEEEMLLQQPISYQAFFCLLCVPVLDPITTKRSESTLCTTKCVQHLCNCRDFSVNLGIRFWCCWNFDIKHPENVWAGLCWWVI